MRLQSRSEEYVESDIVKLREEFADVLKDEPGDTDTVEVSIEVDPIAQVPYRIPDRLKAGVKEELDKLKEAGIIERSTSPWASPTVPVVKPDGNVRLCVDFRRLNSVTRGDPYETPTLDDILQKAGNCTVMLKLDLSKGFYQVRVKEESKEMTAFVSPYGKYQFLLA